MTPLTDQELAALFAKHVRPGDPPPGSAGFVGSRYYAFARELEHRAMVAGMSIKLSEPPAPLAQPEERRGTVAAWLWACFGWFGRYLSGG